MRPFPSRMSMGVPQTTNPPPTETKGTGGRNPKYAYNDDDEIIGWQTKDTKGRTSQRMGYGQKTILDAQQGTGVFHPDRPQNKPWAGYLRFGGGKKVGAEELSNMSYDDYRKMNTKSTAQDYVLPDGSRHKIVGKSGGLSISEFRKLKNKAGSHYRSRTQLANMRKETNEYREAGGKANDPKWGTYDADTNEYITKPGYEYVKGKGMTYTGKGTGGKRKGYKYKPTTTTKGTKGKKK